MAFSSRFWWVALAPALVLSQVLVVMWWTDARFGTIPTPSPCVPLLSLVLSLGSSSSPSTYRREVERGLARAEVMAPVTDADLAPLPPVVQAYLRRAGVVGKPHVQSLRARFKGQMRNGHDGGWMDIDVEQHSFFDEPTRLFYMDAALHGLPFSAFHAFIGPSATMRVRIGSLFTLVDARGPEMNRSETVTFFNDLCLLAPAALLRADVKWEPIGERTVKGIYRQAGDTISADLTFSEEGDLIGFVSHDRLQSADGKTFHSYPWSTPVRAHRDFGHVRLPSQVDAAWIEPTGDFTYARFELVEIVYNAGSNR
ncbi:MAG: DUF6544 family protein [Polyangiaceae bacterium]